MPVDLSSRDFDPDVAELMDVAENADETLRIDLGNLRELNRWFGSYRLIRHYLKKWVLPGSSHHFLDLCTGSGDIPRLIVDWCRARNVSVQIDAFDFQDATLEIAKSLSLDYPEIVYSRQDVTAFPAEPRYTGVFCSLALHHFSESDAIRILEKMRLATTGFALLADLERSQLTWLGVRFITSTVFRQPMTVHDALLSVRRSFSAIEIKKIADAAGWTAWQHRRFLYGRQAVAISVSERSTAIR